MINPFKDEETQDPTKSEPECLEKRVYYKIISGILSASISYVDMRADELTGLHASISTHVCWEDFNQTTGQWVCTVLPPTSCIT
jgi:ERO1-like protein beta